MWQSLKADSQRQPGLKPQTESSRYLPGDLVEVRSVAEILSTLDQNGTFEKLPFMPEMLAFCGKQFRVSAQAFKTCVDDGEMRQLGDTVFLEEVRCDGAAHASCDRGCLIFWKTVWLKRPSEPSLNVNRAFLRVTESDLSELAGSGEQFFCQSSEILNASEPLPWWEPKQYLWDLKYNHTPLGVFSRSFFIAIYNKVAVRFKFRSWKAITGSASTNGFVPLALKPGELVRVKSLSEIKATLDADGKNHKMLFAPAMAAYCGQVMKVRDRVENIVLEATPRQRRIKDTVVLEQAVCDGICHRLCPRKSLLFWRECWLERVNGN